MTRYRYRPPRFRVRAALRADRDRATEERRAEARPPSLPPFRDAA